MKRKEQKKQSRYERIANIITQKTGSTAAFILACASILVWLALGPVFDFSDTWQLVINTGTTVVTFLMVFLIQKTQNKDSIAMQLKLNELVASNEKASNRMVDIEDLSEEELRVLEKYFRKLASMTKKDKDLHVSHSIDEAEARHNSKIKTVSKPG